MMQTMTANKAQFVSTSYQAFRQMIDRVGGDRIKSKGFTTLLYDRHHRLVAKMEAASIDQQGRCHPARYYVNHSDFAVAA